MKVTVLGASGFIGSWAVRALTAEGHAVHALVRSTSDTWRIDSVPGLTIERRTTEDWPAAVTAAQPDALISLDWDGVSASERDDEPTQQRNLERQAAVAAAALGAGATRIVGIGSQAEFGPVNEIIAEDRAPSPVSAYGRAKVASRSALQSLTVGAGAELVWARVFSVFGPLETGPWLFPSIARAAAAAVPFTMSSGTQPWSYLYAADAGRALATLATAAGASGDVAVAHPDAPALRQSAEVLAAAVGAQLRFGDHAGTPLQPEVTRLTQWGWEPRSPAVVALQQTAAWLRGDSIADPLLDGESLPVAR